MTVSSPGGPLSSRGVNEGAESEELTVSKGGNVILLAEHSVVQPLNNTHVFTSACFTPAYWSAINRQKLGT